MSDYTQMWTDLGLDLKAHDARNITISQTVCGICSVTCGINIKLEDGRVLFNTSDRLQYSLKKTGLDSWEEISWNEAYQILVQQLIGLREKYKPEALAVHELSAMEDL